MPSFMTDQLAPSLYQVIGPGMTTNGVESPPDYIYTYGRDFYGDRLETYFTNRASGMVNLGVATSASMLVVGSAFGYLMDALIAQGITDVWGIEPGSFYWDPSRDADWAVGMKARTADDWLGSGTEVASLNALGITGQAKFNWIVDEDAAPGHTDAELPAFIAACEARLQGNVKGRIVHLVTPARFPGYQGDSSQNWKTMAEWEAVAPDHTWVDVRSL